MLIQISMQRRRLPGMYMSFVSFPACPIAIALVIVTVSNNSTIYSNSNNDDGGGSSSSSSSRSSKLRFEDVSAGFSF